MLEIMVKCWNLVSKNIQMDVGYPHIRNTAKEIPVLC